MVFVCNGSRHKVILLICVVKSLNWITSLIRVGEDKGTWDSFSWIWLYIHFISFYLFKGWSTNIPISRYFHWFCLTFAFILPLKLSSGGETGSDLSTVAIWGGVQVSTVGSFLWVHLKTFDWLCFHMGKTGQLIEIWEPRWKLSEVIGSKAIRAN